MGNLRGVYDVKNSFDYCEHGFSDNRCCSIYCHIHLAVQKVNLEHQKRPLINFGQFHGLF